MAKKKKNYQYGDPEVNEVALGKLQKKIIQELALASEFRKASKQLLNSGSNREEVKRKAQAYAQRSSFFQRRAEADNNYRKDYQKSLNKVSKRYGD
jgi:hypothetical protein